MAHCTHTSDQQRAQASLHRQVTAAQPSWQRKCWHLSHRRFACEADAREALERELKGKPTWLEVRSDVVAHPRHAGKGRPRKEASPTIHQWQIVATVTVNQQRVDEEALRKACFIVGTNDLESEALSDQELVTTYKDQGGVERGFRFLKDPLFLASSVFVKKPERIIALSLIMVLCLLVYRLAEFGCEHAWPRQSKPFLIKSASRQHVRRCGGSFNVLKALSCSMCRPPPLHSPSSYVLKRFIG